jgi:hypothetical protein
MNFAASLTELTTTVTDAVLSRKSLLAAVLAMTLAAGCILPIPMPHGKVLQGGEVKSSDLAFLIKFDAADRFVVSETVRKPAMKSFGQFLLDWREAQRAKGLEGKKSMP